MKLTKSILKQMIKEEIQLIKEEKDIFAGDELFLGSPENPNIPSFFHPSGYSKRFLRFVRDMLAYGDDMDKRWVRNNVDPIGIKLAKNFTPNDEILGSSALGTLKGKAMFRGLDGKQFRTAMTTQQKVEGALQKRIRAGAVDPEALALKIKKPMFSGKYISVNPKGNYAIERPLDRTRTLGDIFQKLEPEE